MGHPKRKLVFQPSTFRCYLSFREAKISDKSYTYFSCGLICPILSINMKLNELFASWCQDEKTYATGLTNRQYNDPKDHEKGSWMFDWFKEDFLKDCLPWKCRICFLKTSSLYSESLFLLDISIKGFTEFLLAPFNLSTFQKFGLQASHTIKHHQNPQTNKKHT